MQTLITNYSERRRLDKYCIYHGMRS